MTKAEATEALEARGVTVPADWSAKRVKELLAQLETVPEVPQAPRVAPGRFVTTQTGHSPRG